MMKDMVFIVRGRRCANCGNLVLPEEIVADGCCVECVAEATKAEEALIEDVMEMIVNMALTYDEFVSDRFF